MVLQRTEYADSSVDSRGCVLKPEEKTGRQQNNLCMGFTLALTVANEVSLRINIGALNVPAQRQWQIMCLCASPVANSA